MEVKTKKSLFKEKLNPNKKNMNENIRAKNDKIKFVWTKKSVNTLYLALDYFIENEELHDFFDRHDEVKLLNIFDEIKAKLFIK